MIHPTLTPTEDTTMMIDAPTPTPDPADAAFDRAVAGAVAAVEGSVARLPERDQQFAVREVAARLYERVDQGDFGEPVLPPSRRPGPERPAAVANFLLAQLRDHLREMDGIQAYQTIATLIREAKAITPEGLDPAAKGARHP